jgi:hypothetical protein
VFLLNKKLINNTYSCTGLYVNGFEIKKMLVYSSIPEMVGVKTTHCFLPEDLFSI